MLHLGHFNQLSATGGTSPPWSERFAALARHALDPRLKAFYGAGAVPGDTPLASTPLTAIDFETSGLDPRSHEIVSVGLVPMSLERIRASESRHWILRPRRAVGATAISLHGITHAQIESAPDLDSILGELLALLAGRVLVVHCHQIERGFLAAALRERIGESIEFPVIDTMAIEARIRRPATAGLLERLLGRAPPSIRLADSRARYGLPRYRPHHAPTDALASAELLQAQIAHRFSPDLPVREFWQ